MSCKITQIWWETVRRHSTSLRSSYDYIFQQIIQISIEINYILSRTNPQSIRRVKSQNVRILRRKQKILLVVRLWFLWWAFVRFFLFDCDKLDFQYIYKRRNINIPKCAKIFVENALKYGQCLVLLSDDEVDIFCTIMERTVCCIIFSVQLAILAQMTLLVQDLYECWD